MSYLDDLVGFYRLGRELDAAVDGVGRCLEVRPGKCIRGMELNEVLPATIAVPARRERVNGVHTTGVSMETCSWTKGRLVPSAQAALASPVAPDKEESHGVVWEAPSLDCAGEIDASLQALLRPVTSLGLVGAAHISVAPSAIPTSCLPTSPLQMVRVWFNSAQLLSAQCCAEWKGLSMRVSDGGGGLGRPRSGRGSFFGTSLPQSAALKRSDGGPSPAPSAVVTTALYEFAHTAILAATSYELLHSVLPYFLRAEPPAASISTDPHLDTIRSALRAVIVPRVARDAATSTRLVAGSLSHLVREVLPPPGIVAAVLRSASMLPLTDPPTATAAFGDRIEFLLSSLVVAVGPTSPNVTRAASGTPDTSTTASTPPGTPSLVAGLGGPSTPVAASPQELLVDLNAVVRILQYTLMVRVKLLLADYWMVCIGTAYDAIQAPALRTLRAVYPLFTSLSPPVAEVSSSTFHSPLKYSLVLSRCWIHMGFLGEAAAVAKCLSVMLDEASDFSSECPAVFAQELLSHILPQSAPQVFKGVEEAAPTGFIDHTLKRVETLCLSTVAALALADAEGADVFSSEALALAKVAQSSPNGAISSRAERVLPVVLLLRSEAMQLCPPSPFDSLPSSTRPPAAPKEEWLSLLKQAAVYDHGITRFAGLSLQSTVLGVTDAPKFGDGPILRRLAAAAQLNLGEAPFVPSESGSAPMPPFVHQLLHGYLPALSGPSAAALVASSTSEVGAAFGVDLRHQFDAGFGYPSGGASDGRDTFLREMAAFEADVKRALNAGRRYTFPPAPRTASHVGDPCSLCVYFPCNALVSLLRPFSKELRRLSALEIPGNTQRVRRTAPLSLTFPPMALMCRELWAVNMGGANPLLCTSAQVESGMVEWEVPFLTFFSIESRWGGWWSLLRVIDWSGSLLRALSSGGERCSAIADGLQRGDVAAMVGAAVHTDSPLNSRIQALDAAALLIKKNPTQYPYLWETEATPQCMPTPTPPKQALVPPGLPPTCTPGLPPVTNGLSSKRSAAETLLPTSTTDPSLSEISNAMPRAPSSRSATPTVPDALRPAPINTSFDTSRGRTPLRKATAFGGTYVVPEANSRRQTPLREPTPKRDDRWL